MPLTAVRGGANERVVMLATADTDDAEMAGLVDAIRRRLNAGRYLSPIKRCFAAPAALSAHRRRASNGRRSRAHVRFPSSSRMT